MKAMWLRGKDNTVNDEELAVRYFETGDQSVFGILFERHVKTVYGVCLFYFRDEDKAKDVAMHVFEKLMQELRKSRVKYFKAWLSFVVRNFCISELRKEKGKKFLPETYLDFEIQEASLEEEERIEQVNDETMLRFLEHNMTKLKENQRKCIELFYLRERSYQEVAQETGYSLNEVKSYIQNGKRNLKLLIEEQIRNKKHAA